jgi:hypothetical protein
MALYAYDPVAGKIVFTGDAGTWPDGYTSPSAVPVVANGHVYVASYQQLTIWGLPSGSATLHVNLAHPLFKNPITLAPGEHAIVGTIVAVQGTTIVLRKRDGSTCDADTSHAITNKLLGVGQVVQVAARSTKAGIAVHWIAHLRGPSSIWPSDQ